MYWIALRYVRVVHKAINMRPNRVQNLQTRCEAGYSPTWPTACSQTASRCPTCRAYSCSRWNSTRSRVGGGAPSQRTPGRPVSVSCTGTGCGRAWWEHWRMAELANVLALLVGSMFKVVIRALARTGAPRRQSGPLTRHSVTASVAATGAQSRSTGDWVAKFPMVPSTMSRLAPVSRRRRAVEPSRSVATMATSPL